MTDLIYPSLPRTLCLEGLKPSQLPSLVTVCSRAMVFKLSETTDIESFIACHASCSTGLTYCSRSVLYSTGTHITTHSTSPLLPLVAALCIYYVQLCRIYDCPTYSITLALLILKDLLGTNRSNTYTILNRFNQIGI